MVRFCFHRCTPWLMPFTQTLCHGYSHMQSTERVAWEAGQYDISFQWIGDICAQSRCLTVLTQPFSLPGGCTHIWQQWPLRGHQKSRRVQEQEEQHQGCAAEFASSKWVQLVAFPCSGDQRNVFSLPFLHFVALQSLLTGNNGPSLLVRQTFLWR